MTSLHRKIFFFASLALAALLSLLSSCANIGRPSGGPRDEDPPLLVNALPTQGSVDVSRTKAVLTFNEIVNVRDAFSNVIISPPSKAVPRVTALGKKVTIEFDSLAPNTTYTVDFGDAIEDNNEGNPLRGFTYSFATGPDIDTLRIAGRVLSARDLEPRQGIYVGVYEAPNDSGFTTRPMLRVAKTDDRGRFIVRGLRPGAYNVVALEDRDNNYFYSTPEEDIAFYPVAVSPSAESTVARDTVYNPITGLPDTVLSRTRTRYLPNDILLRSFNSERRQQYLAKYERQDSNRIHLKLNTVADRLPSVRVVGKPALADFEALSVVESSARFDSIFYWLRPELASIDSLQLAVEYLRTDTAGNLAQAVDTLNFYRTRHVAKKNKKKDSVKPRKLRESELKKLAADSIAALTFSINLQAGNPMDVNKPLEFEFPVPPQSFDLSMVHVETTTDSVWKPVTPAPVISRPDSLQPRRYRLEYPWQYGTKYRLSIDSVAATDIYGRTSLPLQSEFTSKSQEDYCTLTFSIAGLDGEPAFVELVDASDRLVDTRVVKGNVVRFDYLTPGKYYARIIIDTNGNGLYDTGDYEQRLQPEVAYYYPKAINIKKNWDKEENWDIFATAIDLQKPTAVLRNKPTPPKHAKPEKQKEEEDDDEPFNPHYQ